MVHELNLPSPFSKYFVSNIDLNAKGNYFQYIKTAGRILYSFEAKRKIAALIREEKPDVAHLHNVCHHLSPSIIDALKENQVPTVMTLHDFKLVCPAYYLLRDGCLCDKCRGGRYYHCFINHCTRGSSYLRSALNMLEMYLHHQILHVYEKVDLFISPSRFLKRKIKEMGFKGEIAHLPNFVNVAEYQPTYEWKEEKILYFGRISREKGLVTLIDVVKSLDVQLEIVGEGPQKEALEKKIDGEGIKNIRFLGYKNGNELQEEVQKSMFVVLPSECYENNPCSVLEAFALGKPVIGSRIGGIPELVENGETGLTFEPRNSSDLKEKIKILTENKTLIVKMGKNARRVVEEKLNPEKHYKDLLTIYEKVIQRNLN
jgi:glycosyltransferase involved in cell wall biosynthesis